MKAAVIDSQANAAAPGKLFYRIQEVAKMTGLKPYVLRYWESEFKELAPGKDASEQRRYRQSDIEIIQAIRKLLYEDRFTIQGARKRLRNELQKIRGAAAENEAELEMVPPCVPARIAAETPGRTVDTTLRRLRSEVSELISMLQN